MRNGYKLIIVVLVSLFLFVYVAPHYVNWGIDRFNGKTNLKVPHVWNVPFRLGLDLLGGTHLVYQADLSQLKDQNGGDAMSGIRDVIERRVNIFGVAEPLVQVSGTDRLIVELAGIKDVNEAIKLIGETPFLEFREQNPKPQAEKDKIPQYTVVNGQLVPDQYANYISTGLNGKDVQSATVVFDQQTYRPQVSLKFTNEGGKLFAAITKRNLGKTVAIFLDGVPISTPTVQSEITDGSAVITGQFTPQEAKLLAGRLNSGALPVPIKLVSQQTIGASLGASSLYRSLRAGVYSMILVGIFMIAFYRLPGLMSVIALLFYTLVVLAFYKFVPVTLTLAGIAGFILSLGMAVDANILIFARMKEELAAGKTIAAAVQEGFRRAWLSIRDGHMTTMIGAIGLYAFTTSLVKGFALTLGIGVLTSLFTATVITRIFMNSFIGPKFENKKWLFK